MQATERVVPLHEVVELMQKGIRAAFNCDISFYTQGTMIFTFNSKKKDPILQLRVSNDVFEIIDSPRVEADTLLDLATAFKNASACMTALQVSPKG